MFQSIQRNSKATDISMHKSRSPVKAKAWLGVQILPCFITRFPFSGCIIPAQEVQHMGIWDKLKGELIDIIEWLDDTRDTMVWRYPRADNEIKYGAKLVVREGQ